MSSARLMVLRAILAVSVLVAGASKPLRGRRTGSRRGSALYNVRFTDIKSDDYQNFAGPTQLCQIIREEIRSNPGQRRGHVSTREGLVCPLAAGDLMLPLRMGFETAFGYLAELRGHSVHLHMLQE